ncbi:MAG: hypothetical protein K8H86_07880 [Ignavibacteriaceae bacterium]|nr:hypothetical protein [Ignavibacteriaceae bacterium]
MEKRQYVYLLFVLIIFSPPGFAGEYENFIAKGNEYYKKFENLNALKQYEKAYVLMPDNYESLTKLTRVYNDYGEEMTEADDDKQAEIYFKKAMNLSEKLLTKFPDSACSYTYCALSLGNYAIFVGGNEKIKFANQIERNCKKAIQLNPNDFIPYIILGIYNRELANLSWLERIFANTFFGKVPDGKFEDAERLFKKALEINNNLIVAHYQLSKIYRLIGNRQLEIDSLKKVLEMPLRDFRDKYSKAKAEKRLSKLN